MTQHYVGTKIVQAWENNTPQGDGYSVKYGDGYISWCPKDKFEEANVALGQIGHLPPHQQRIVAELEQLADRTAKLESFLSTPFYASMDEDEKHLMKMQADAMVLYLGILNTRANKFGGGK